MIEGRQFVGAELVTPHQHTAQRRIETAARGYRDDGLQAVLIEGA